MFFLLFRLLREYNFVDFSSYDYEKSKLSHTVPNFCFCNYCSGIKEE